MKRTFKNIEADRINDGINRANANGHKSYGYLLDSKHISDLRPFFIGFQKEGYRIEFKTYENFTLCEFFWK